MKCDRLKLMWQSRKYKSPTEHQTARQNQNSFLEKLRVQYIR
jgi:hypothetical protein